MRIRMRTRGAVAFAIAMVVGLGGCGGAASSADGEGEVAAASGGAQSSGAESLPAPDIDGVEARRLVADGAFLLDVTMSPRNEMSEIEGRTNIPMNELEGRMGEVPRDRPVVVYCYGGRGSPRAAQMLRDAGYTDVHLLGAMSNWEGASAPPGAAEDDSEAEETSSEDEMSP